MLLVITSMSVTSVMVILALLLFFFMAQLRKIITVAVIVIGVYYVANGHLPWSPTQGQKAVKKVTGIFKEDKYKR